MTLASRDGQVDEILTLGVPDSPALTARITALEAALDRHELEVEFADRRVRYRSVTEIIGQIEYFRSQLRDVSSRPRQFLGVAGRGLV